MPQSHCSLAFHFWILPNSAGELGCRHWLIQEASQMYPTVILRAVGLNDASTHDPILLVLPHLASTWPAVSDQQWVLIWVPTSPLPPGRGSCRVPQHLCTSTGCSPCDKPSMTWSPENLTSSCICPLASSQLVQGLTCVGSFLWPAAVTTTSAHYAGWGWGSQHSWLWHELEGLRRASQREAGACTCWHFPLVCVVLS